MAFLKLHFVLGLPTETRTDVDAITDVVRNCVEIGQEYGDKAMFHAALSPYIPRSHTRWQWERQITVDDYLSSVDYLRAATQKQKTLKLASPRRVGLP